MSGPFDITTHLLNVCKTPDILGTSDLNNISVETLQESFSCPTNIFPVHVPPQQLPKSNYLLFFLARGLELASSTLHKLPKYSEKQILSCLKHSLWDPEQIWAGDSKLERYTKVQQHMCTVLAFWKDCHRRLQTVICFIEPLVALFTIHFWAVVYWRTWKDQYVLSTIVVSFFEEVNWDTHDVNVCNTPFAFLSWKRKNLLKFTYFREAWCGFEILVEDNEQRELF